MLLAFSWLCQVSVAFETHNGTAVAGKDYEYTAGNLHFNVGQRLASITIPIIDDQETEPDENFFCSLRQVSARDKPEVNNQWPSCAVLLAALPVRGVVVFVVVVVVVRAKSAVFAMRVSRVYAYVPCATLKQGAGVVKIFPIHTAEITIIDDDTEGVFDFDTPNIT